MKRSFRQAAAALALVATSCLIATSPALAAPREEPAGSATLSAPRLVAELWASLGQWFEGVLVQSISAPAGGGTAPQDLSGSSDSDGDLDGLLTPQDGHQIDPNG